MSSTVADRTAAGVKATADAAAEADAEADATAARQAKAAERAAVKDAKERARQPYLGLSKAELSEKLTSRGLPKSGTIEALITRLVQSDSSK